MHNKYYTWFCIIHNKYQKWLCIIRNRDATFSITAITYYNPERKSQLLQTFSLMYNTQQIPQMALYNTQQILYMALYNTQQILYMAIYNT